MRTRRAHRGRAGAAPPIAPTAPAASARRPRDSQRQRCYDAESSLPPLAQGRPLRTVAEIQRYLDDLLATWPTAGPLPPVRVGSGSGSRRARAVWSLEGGHRIQVPVAMRTELVVLHEAAHVVTSHELGFDGAAAHGWQWARTYLQMVGQRIGDEAGDALVAAFEAHRVRFTP